MKLQEINEQLRFAKKTYRPKVLTKKYEASFETRIHDALLHFAELAEEHPDFRRAFAKDVMRDYLPGASKDLQEEIYDFVIPWFGRNFAEDDLDANDIEAEAVRLSELYS